MGMNGSTGSIGIMASGVVIRSDPVTWWMIALVVAVVFMVIVLAFLALAHWDLSDTVSVAVLLSLSLGLTTAMATPLSRWSDSVSSSNGVAIESRYGVSSLAVVDGERLLPGSSKPIPVTFRDPRGTHRGYVTIDDTRAVLSADGNRPGLEYIRGGGYSYSGTPITGIRTVDAKGSGD